MTNPLPKGWPWCEICRTNGHDPYHFPMIQKYKIVPNITFHNFFKSIGNEDKDYRTFEIMKERTSNTYRVQDELMITCNSLQHHCSIAHNSLKHHRSIILCNHNEIRHVNIIHRT